MIEHDAVAAMLLWPDELSLADQAALARHVRACPTCRSLAEIYAENRERLRLLAQVRPPQAVREAVLDRAVEAREAAGLYVPLAFAFAAFPLSLIAVCAVLVYGLPALAVCVALGVLLTGLTIAQGVRRERLTGIVRLNPERSLSRFLAALLIDTVGVVAGTLLLCALLALVAVVSSMVR